MCIVDESQSPEQKSGVFQDLVRQVVLQKQEQRGHSWVQEFSHVYVS